MSNHILKLRKKFILDHNYLGPSYSSKNIEKKLKKYSLKYTFYKNINDEAVKAIIEGKVIGWFQEPLNLEIESFR